ncbi:unnamed protein product [Rotaria sp. Silwood1]|nr:unnamed protein product [Rotaria sp. Silwood1]
MDYSTVQLLDLPDEILIEILNKLNNIDVLCTVLGVNKRLERLARDTIFTDFLDLTTKSSLGGICSMSNIILDRFCSSILPQIHHNIKSLVLESSSIEHILIACVYPKLHKLTLYSIKPEVFIKYLAGGDGGGAGACYGRFYPDTQRVVALSTGWYNKGSRCGKIITIRGNGRTTTAQVVDECDSVHGCDAEHAGQPPCRNNIVDGSPAVWKALGVSKNDPRYGEMKISWSN